MVSLRSIFALTSLGLARATAVNVKREAITTLTSAQVSAFTPFTYFASAAYCNPSTTISWTCGGGFIRCSTLEARPEVVLLK